MLHTLRLLLTMALLLAGTRSVFAQGYGQSSEGRPDPYAPRYPLNGSAAGGVAGPTASIGLPPVPSLSGAAPAAQPAPSVYSPQYRNAPPPATPPPAAASQRYPLPQIQAPAAAPPSSPVAPPSEVAPAPEVGSGATEPVINSTLFKPAETVAIVGNQYILYGDVSPTVDQYLAAAMTKAKTDEDVRQIEAAREALTRQILKQMIETKLTYLEFVRDIEAKAGKEKLAEAMGDIMKRVTGSFDKELATAQEKVVGAKPEELQEMMRKDPYIPRLALTMHENNLLTPGELDVYLRNHGSSLAKQRRAWIEYAIGRSNLGEKLKVQPEISHLEMLDYYNDQADKFRLQAKAKFEILTVRFDRYPSKDAAWQAMAAMGNEVFFGAPFAAVAKKHSQEPNADKGGVYDWTNQGSLASTAIDQAIFSVEVGKLSQILEDERGFHIVRVIERQEAGQVPFVEAQTKIKEAIAAENRNEQFKELVMGLRTKTPVWTIYDTPAEVSARGAAGSGLAPR